MVFTIYGRGGHLGHVTWTIYINFLSPFPRRLLMFGFDWPSGFREEENGGHIHVYSPGAGSDDPLESIVFSSKHLFYFSHFSPLQQVFPIK